MSVMPLDTEVFKLNLEKMTLGWMTITLFDAYASQGFLFGFKHSIIRVGPYYRLNHEPLFYLTQFTKKTHSCNITFQSYAIF